MDECPVSVLSKPTLGTRKDGYITGARAAQLLKMWHRAQRHKMSLSEFLGSDEAWIQDAEEVFIALQEQVEQAHRNDVEARAFRQNNAPTRF